MYSVIPTSSQQNARPHWLIILSCLIIGCLLLLSACDGINSLTGASARTLSVHKPAPELVIDTSLIQQGQAQIQAFQQWIALMQQYKGDTSKYQQEYTSDQHALASARTNNAYQGALQILSQHVNSIKIPALQSEASILEQQLQQQTSSWSKHHTYYDNYNGITYPLAYEYGPNGVGGWSQQDLANARTIAAYQQVIEETNISLTNFRAYKTNAGDKTPWNYVHQSDLQLIQHYGYRQTKVIVISLSEQALRIYNHGKLVNAFLATTGRPEKPSIPGNWWVESKQSPTVFKSDDPKGSPYWYPDTPINYAMLYHSGGYFIHDSWWRSNYGPDTQFPHVDASGDSYSFDGSHGCVNVTTSEAAWIYNYVDLNTHIIIY